MKPKIPLYHKVYDYILERIEKEYRPGDMLPTQAELAHQTQTSLITVKRAIKELEAAGHLESRAGKGTTVKKPQIVDNHVGVSSWTDSIIGRGKTPSTSWTKIGISLPVGKVAQALNLKARQRTVRIERLRLIDDQPICLIFNELPVDMVPGLDMDTDIGESMYTFLRDEYGHVGVSADEEVYARKATNYEIGVLKLETPIVLVIERVSFLVDEIPFEVSSIVAAADSYVYRSRQINKTVGTQVLHDLLTKAQ